MRGWFAVYYREALILKKKFFKVILSMSLTPALYLVAFGYGMGKGVSVDGRSYLEFLIPGLIAMAGMNHAFAIAGEINISRFYWRIFEEFQTAPIRPAAYVAGETLAGVTRAILSAMVIIAVASMFGVPLSYNIWFWLGVVLNGFVFSSVAVWAAMVVRSHSDQGMLTNFIITPMAFLGGTVFPLSNMPGWAQTVLSALPITHASHAIRGAAFGQPPGVAPFAALTMIGAICFSMALASVARARN